jgi:quinol monooxygenase YgiN
MINRLVRMHFKTDEIAVFLEIFEHSKEHIRSFPGCRHLELWADTREKGVFFTYSRWDSEESLDHYRYSPLFKSVWSRVKPLFAQPATAWSLEKKY